MPKKKASPEYTQNRWHGIVRFECKLCGFDVLKNERTMLRHLLNVHNSEAALSALIAGETRTAKASPKKPAPKRTPKKAKKDEGELVYVDVTEDELAALDALSKE